MYCRKEMVKILQCYLIPKKVMALCLRVQFYLANPVVVKHFYWWISIHSTGYKLTFSAADFQSFSYFLKRKYELISRLGFAWRLYK